MRIPIGIDNFRELITDRDSQDEHYLYIDKTLMIGAILDEPAKISLITRPRRFGKTLNLSMLQHFLAEEVDGQKTEGLFEGLHISKNNVYMKHQGQYPVIFITFKDLKDMTWDKIFDAFKEKIRNLFNAHKYLLNSQQIDDWDKERFKAYGGDLTYIQIVGGITFLTKMLKKHYGKGVFILLDEYDTPIQSAYLGGFYKEVVSLMSNVFGETFKGNDALEKGVLTGITRVSKESLFSGFNNAAMYTILEPKYSQYFGFTPEEVQAICPQYFDTITEWYNGYEFGVGSVASLDPRFLNMEQTIYNPWSVLNFLYHGYRPGHYWINTSDNALIKELMKPEHLKLMEMLIKHEKIEAVIDINLTFEDLGHDEDAFWCLLLMAGYLTMDSKYKLRIPNKEIEEFYIKMLKQWFSGKGARFFDECLEALVQGNVEDFKERFQIITQQSLSFHDIAYGRQESFYHGLMLGFVIGLRDRYIIKSNRESGYGRYDIGLIPRDPKRYPGIIIECKYEKDAKAALKQIDDRAYASELRQHGCQKVLLYGFAFDGKDIDVVLATEF